MKKSIGDSAWVRGGVGEVMKIYRKCNRIVTKGEYNLKNYLFIPHFSQMIRAIPYIFPYSGNQLTKSKIDTLLSTASKYDKKDVI